MDSAAGEACQLPVEIEEKIVKEHLSTFAQLASFSGVCRSWRSIAKEINISCFPGILVSKTSCAEKKCKEHGCDFDERSRCRRCHCCNIVRGVTHHRFCPISTIFNSTTTRGATPHPPFPPLLRSPQDCVTTRKMMLRGPHGLVVGLEKWHCVASKDGWLVLAQRNLSRVQFYLMNPITGASIPLRPLRSRRHSFKNIVLSSSPDDHNCHLFVSYRRKVVQCKVSDGIWKYSTHRYFESIQSACYIGGKLYVVDDIENCVNEIDDVVNDDVVGRPSTVRSIPLSSDMRGMSYHAMELDRQLILVCRRHLIGEENSVAFRVYKLVGGGGREEENQLSSELWEEVGSLDGHAMFLGTHQSFCVPINESNRLVIRGDHVYYLDNSCGQCELQEYHSCDCGYWSDRRRLKHWGFCGVYSLADGKLVEHSRLPTASYQDYIWILPMPWDIPDNNKMAEMHLTSKKIDDDEFELLYKHKKTNRDPDNRIIPGHNSFEALSLVD
ncbi:hypothetical protein LINGRAHAP2_LOCUS29812 [Linum grandiflorum]